MSVEPTGTRTPLEPSHALLALEEARDREQIFDLLLRAVRSKARFAALFSVHADHFRGRRALSDEGFDCSRIDALRISRNSVPAFEAAVVSRAPSVGAIATGEPFVDGLLEACGGLSRTTLLLPVSIGNRTVALLVAHGGDAALTPSVTELFPLVAASNPALTRVLAARSAAAATRPARAASEGYEVEVSVEGPAGKRAALAADRAREAWPEVAATIRELIRDGMDTGDPDEDEQLELLIELGHVEAKQLGEPERALAAWRSAQSIDASDSRVLDAFEELFVQQGRWLDCVELLEKRVALTEGKRPRIAMLLNLAAMAHERLDDDERALEAYERVLQLDPADPVASRELEAIYAARQAWEPLAALLLERASRATDASAVTALESIASIYEDRTGDARAAFLVWLAVFRREPTRIHLVDELDRLAPAADAWDEVIAECQALAGELEAAHPETAAALWHLVGRWSRDRTGNHEAAAIALERSLRLAPTDVDTWYELVELLRAEGRWAQLIAVLSERAATEQDFGRRSELYAELGDIYENRLAEPADAVASYQCALADEPESPQVLVALHRCYLATEAWPALAELLPQLVDVLAMSAPATVIVDLHVELGSVFAEHLARPEDAIRAYRAALALDPRHAAALQGLERIYQSTGQAEALLDATETAVDGGSREDQLARYRDLASAWHDHARYDRAAACWQKLVTLDPRDLAAHQGRARALGAGQQWAPFVVALHAQLKLLTDPAERIALLLELASVFENPLHDVDGATAAYREVVKLDPQHAVAASKLAGLYEAAGRAQQALELLQRLLEATTAPRARADLLQRIGHVHLGLRDAVNARLGFVQAIALDLENARAREGMARVLVQQGELVAGGEELVRAARLSTATGDRLRCLLDAAWLYRHRLDDAVRARECLHLTLELDPEHADARQALAELLHDTQQWETLWPHLADEVERVFADASVPASERLDVYTRAARCAVELANFPTALELYELACAIDPGPGSLLERADALYRSKALDAAARAYHAIATKHFGGLERAQLATVYRRLATIHTELGKLPQAQLFHGKVLELEPGHRETLADLAELQLARDQFDEAIATLRTLAAGGAGAERVSYLERIGDLLRDRLANRARAMSTYLEALELDPENRRILQRVLDLQTEAGQWKAAVETIGRFLEHETNPARRGAYCLASAEIRRNELKDKPGALEHYEAALDELFRVTPLGERAHARGLDAFRALEELVVADENWKYLEQAYRRMIKRLPKDDTLLVPLWHALGEVYRTRLQHPRSAIEAFEVAHALDPSKSAQRSRILAELYAGAGAARHDAASERVAKLVEVDPSNPDAYRALGRTAIDAGRIDEAWCVARALVLLKKATPQEHALYEQYRSQEARKATGILDEDSWSLVRHADEDPAISAIFAIVWDAIAALRGGPVKSFELKSKERMPVEHDTRVVAKIFRHASRLVNVSLPDVYVQPRRPGRLLLANTLEKGRLAPAVIVGRDLMTGYRDTEIAAAVGAMIATLRPAYYLKLTLATTDELEAALAAAAQLVGKRVGRSQLEPMTATFLPELQKRITRPVAETLLALVNRLSAEPDLVRWRNAVDAAAQRAGLLVSGELAATARMISSEPTLPGGLRPNQRVQELVTYSVSPSYFAARAHLNVTLG